MTALANHIAEARTRSFAFFMGSADSYLATNGLGSHGFFMQVTLLGAVASLAKHHGPEVAAQWLNAAAADIGVQLAASPPIRQRPTFLRGFILGAVVTAVVGAVIIGGFVICNVF
jgi:hypothetical protein